MSTTVVVAFIFVLALTGALAACHFVVGMMQRGAAARQAALAEDPRGPWGG